MLLVLWAHWQWSVQWNAILRLFSSISMRFNGIRAYFQDSTTFFSVDWLQFLCYYSRWCTNTHNYVLRWLCIALIKCLRLLGGFFGYYSLGYQCIPSDCIIPLALNWLRILQIITCLLFSSCWVFARNFIVFLFYWLFARHS